MTSESTTPPDGYTIDVCATCGRHAVYPFSCGHRSSTALWTVPIHVKPTAASRTFLTAQIRAALTRSAQTR